MRTDQIVERLEALDLRDRWGYQISEAEIVRLAVWLKRHPDADEDALAIQMLTAELPQVCQGYDTPADDPLLREILNAAQGENA